MRLQAERSLVEPETSSKKRGREAAGLEGFGAELDDEPSENSKMPKLSEGELPKQDYTTEKSEGEVDLDQTAAPKRKSALDDIFDTQEEDDYDRSADRASRLAYLNSLGSKKKPQPSPSDESTFRGSSSSRAEEAPSSGARGSWKGDSIFKSPSMTSTRSKLEQQEFVKDSVQSKIARESTPTLKQAPSKSLDFGALMQKISDRQKEIRLPTAEQVGLAALLAEDGQFDADDDELSLEEAQEDDDEISLEIDDDEGEKVDSTATNPKPSAAPFKAPALPVSAPKSKKLVLDEDDEGAASSAQSTKPSVAPSSKPRNLFSLDDFELDDDEKPASLVTPSLTQTMDILPELPSAAVDESSQTSVTDSSLQLEYPPTLEPESVKPTTTPAGMALKTEPSNKPSLLSSWLANTTTAKKSSSPASKAKSEATISRSKSKQREALDAPLFDGELLDENAMTGNDDSNGPKLDKSGTTLKRLQKTRQLFDDEAEAGYGSEGDQVEARDRDRADSADESEGGASQDAYENEGVHPSDADKVVEKRSALDDIFETDDRAVVRSLQVQQDIDRERAEQKAMEDMTWRRERRSRRHELALHAEANALLEDRRMEDRLAARRSQKRDSKTASKSSGGKATAAALGDSASLPVPTTEKEWFMDDSDEEGDDSHQENERRRLQLLDEQQTRRRLASNSLFLSHDEDSQSILQVIDRAHTQHSQHSNPASFDDHNSSSQFASANPLASSESQDSLGGWFDRPGLAASNFSASNAEHLSKLKTTYKGHATQVLTSSLLFQRSQDGFEGSQDGFKDPAPLTRSQSNVTISASSKRKK